MKRFLLSFLVCLSLAVSAQDSVSVARMAAFRFGYLSYDSALHAMAEYAHVQQSMDKLRQQYTAELQRVEQDFNQKYEEFLEGQRDFPETILRKRQTELRELLERNVAFKDESRRQLASEEERLLAPLKARLSEVMAAVAMERGYAFILNTDLNAVPIVNPAMGEDASTQVLSALRKRNVLNSVIR